MTRKYRGIPTSIRKKVIERDGEACRYCGCLVLLPNKPMAIDHIVPWSKGGKNILENLVVACVPCNLAKSDSTLKESGLTLFPVGFFKEVVKAAKDHLVNSSIQTDWIACPVCGTGFDRYTLYGGAGTKRAVPRSRCSDECYKVKGT